MKEVNTYHHNLDSEIIYSPDCEKLESLLEDLKDVILTDSDYLLFKESEKKLYSDSEMISLIEERKFLLSKLDDSSTFPSESNNSNSDLDIDSIRSRIYDINKKIESSYLYQDYINKYRKIMDQIKRIEDEIVLKYKKLCLK